MGIEGGQAAAGRIKNATHGRFFKRQARKDPECKMMIKNISMGSACCEMKSEINFGGLHCALSIIIQGRSKKHGCGANCGKSGSSLKCKNMQHAWKREGVKMKSKCK